MPSAVGEQFASPAGPAATLLLSEAGARVTAIPHEVQFEHGRWYADIALPGVAAGSYCPLVALSVARYQAASLEDLELSATVKGDIAPLLPDRTLHVDALLSEIDGDGALARLVNVTLEGLGPTGPRANRVDAVVEACRLPAAASSRDGALFAGESPRDDIPA